MHIVVQEGESRGSRGWIMAWYVSIRFIDAKLLFLLLHTGSCLHSMRALEHPRWEDFKYELFDGSAHNRFHWLGDGSTYNEAHMTGDREHRKTSREFELNTLFGRRMVFERGSS